MKMKTFNAYAILFVCLLVTGGSFAEGTKQVSPNLIALFNKDVFVIDSMPLEICHNARESRLKICKEDLSTSPAKRFCASQNRYYFGYKRHDIFTFNGVFTSIYLPKANVHNVNYLKDVKVSLSDCTLLANKRYIDCRATIGFIPFI